MFVLHKNVTSSRSQCNCWQQIRMKSTTHIQLWLWPYYTRNPC